MRIRSGLALVTRALCLSFLALNAQETAKPAPDFPSKKAPTPTSDPQTTALADGQVRQNSAMGTTEAYLPILFPSSHAANLLELKNGDILCVWFSGNWEGSSNVGIVFSRLRKGTKRWEKTRLIDNQDGLSFQNPVLFQAPDGVIHLYHTTQEAEKGEANE